MRVCLIRSFLLLLTTSLMEKDVWSKHDKRLHLLVLGHIKSVVKSSIWCGITLRGEKEIIFIVERKCLAF